MTKVINFYGCPGAGKSSHAAALFAHMKRHDINCELVNEYAKHVTWRKAQPILADQLYVFAKQHNAQFVLNGQVDYIITDSPLILSLYYGRNEGAAFQELVRDKWNGFDNITFYVNRTKPYNPKGRNQTEAESNQIACEMRNLVDVENFELYNINSDTSVEYIYGIVMSQECGCGHAYYIPEMIK